MKKAGIIIGGLITILLVLYFIFTGPVSRTPYFETDYYKTSCTKIDSLKKNISLSDDSLLAGFSKVSITPQLGSETDDIENGRFIKVPLAGFGARKGAPSSGIHDSLFVKAAALKVGKQLVVFVGTDLLIVPPNVTDSVMVILSKKGFSREQLFFSATHTHSSLGAWGNSWVGEQFAGEYNPNLVNWLSNQISTAVIKAIADLKPAAIATGNFNAADYTRNRLIGERATKNDDFSFIYLEQQNGKKAVIGSFAAHATTMGDENMQISGDYPGYWERKMENTSVDYAIFFAGSVGSQTNRGEGEGFEKPKYIGESLADSLNVYLKKVTPERELTLSTVSLKMELPDYHIRLSTKRNLATSVCQKINPVPDNSYLQAVRLENMIWITTPSDFSGEYALQIKNALAVKGFDANITSFNGNYLGYIIPGRYFYLNKYEPKDMGWFGPNMGDYTIDLIYQLTEIVM
ncbi:MAG: neutral/alkaline non-lysosomal ceramidase N-terminal domain-containing protein [Draconibacterium sp.]